MILARAPLRISLGGGGTDLPSYYNKHGGFILSGAIDKYVYIHVNRPAADELIRLKYSRYEQVSSGDEIQHGEQGRPRRANLMRLFDLTLSFSTGLSS